MNFTRLFDEAGCIGSLHAVRLSDGAEVSHDADRPHVLASVVKVPIGLEFYAQADDGRVDPTEMVALVPALRTPGPVGISQFEDTVTMSLRDLSYLMLTISDNAAADAVTAAVGIPAVNNRLRAVGCRETVVVESLQAMLDGVASEMGYGTYPELVAAQNGAKGPEAQAMATRPRAHRPLSSARSPKDIADNGEGCHPVARGRLGRHRRQSASVRDASTRHVGAGDSASR